jgi:serine protease Do
MQSMNVTQPHDPSVPDGPPDAVDSLACDGAQHAAPVDVRGASASMAEAGASSKDRLGWLLSASAFLVLLTFFLPYTVEKMTFAFVRGKQRAMYETAGEKLQNVALRDLSQAYQLVANRVEPSVVHINVTAQQAASAAALEGTPWQPPATGQGSGVIVDPEGYIVTNAHVLLGAGRIRVRLSDGRSMLAAIVGLDRPTDLAVLKISATDLLAAQWGDSDEVDVGALVWALGSPLGLEQSVTFGILSGKHRSFSAESSSGMLNVTNTTGISPYHDFLQTDAAVNPGNSGGPLVDSRGKVIGINTAIVGETYQGISLAIPSSIARPVVERIVRDGRVTRGWLGVSPRDVAVEEAGTLGLSKPEGALIVEVRSKPDGSPSPAQIAGLEQDDVVTRWANKPIRGRTDLFSAVAMTEIGATVEVVIVRSGQTLTRQVTVADRPVGSN